MTGTLLLYRPIGGEGRQPLHLVVVPCSR